MLPSINRPINFRPILLFALSFVFGIVIFRYSPSLKVWTVLIPVSLAVFVGGTFYLVDKNHNRNVVVYTTLFCLFFAFLGIAMLGLQVKAVTDGYHQSGRYVVEGEVSSVTYDSGVWRIALTNCFYDGEKGGDLFIYNVKREVSLYDIVRVECDAFVNVRYQDGKISSNILNGYSMSASSVYGIDKIGVADNLYAKFKVATDKIFKKAVGENAGILSALIRGDTSVMKDTVNLFRMVGIAHVFAVSGMHVGLLFTALTYLIKKLRINRLIGLFIVCFLLIFYSYLCGFTPSSLRASIMCSVIAIGDRYLGEKYDGINSISIATILVLMVNPKDLFSIGYILSFAICFSLIVFAPPIKRVLAFLPQKISSTLSVLIASQLVAIPLSIKYFGGFSLISFLANLLLLPIVSVLFYVTVIGLIVCLILPLNCYFVMFATNVILTFVKSVATYVSQFPLRLDYFPSHVAIFYYPLILISSDFINASKKFKFSCAVLAVVLLVFVSLRSFLPFTL